jgi:preprotein translocase subunit SecY
MLSLFRVIYGLYKNTDFFKKLLFTLFVLIVYRMGTFIPVVGINVQILKEYITNSSIAGGLLDFLDLFSAGSLSQCALFALGIGPAITASIIMQLAGFSIPKIEALTKEGEYGRTIINHYTRILALCLSVFYSLGYAVYLESIPGVVFNPGLSFKFVFVLSLVAGCMFVMWLGDQIKVIGIGNGSSMIIFAGIISRFPSYFIKTISAVKTGNLTILSAYSILIIFCLIAICIIFLEKGDRKVSVHYARKIVGNRMFNAQTSFIPFKINTVGVMPVIFANSTLNVPLFIVKILSKYAFFAGMSQYFGYKGAIYNTLLFGLIIFWTYTYMVLVFNPVDLSDNLKKNGGFIAGIRPGKQTSDFFDYILVRIGFIGSIYLATLAVFPNIIPVLIPAIPFDLGGTSLLIVIGVALDFLTQIRTYLLEHRYDNLISSK